MLVLALEITIGRLDMNWMDHTCLSLYSEQIPQNLSNYSIPPPGRKIPGRDLNYGAFEEQKV
ncbi:hypothetical protein C0J52_07286 [Blattella germanica]|nr:hypothetical protein C0J52_07286 [Blattella germanica]